MQNTRTPHKRSTLVLCALYDDQRVFCCTFIFARCNIIYPQHQPIGRTQASPACPCFINSYTNRCTIILQLLRSAGAILIFQVRHQHLFWSTHLRTSRAPESPTLAPVSSPNAGSNVTCTDRQRGKVPCTSIKPWMLYYDNLNVTEGSGSGQQLGRRVRHANENCARPFLTTLLPFFRNQPMSPMVQPSATALTTHAVQVPLPGAFSVAYSSARFRSTPFATSRGWFMPSFLACRAASSVL